MGRKRTKALEGDRIVLTSTGEMGTITAVHNETSPKGAEPNYGVLPDTGPRRRRLWKGADVEWSIATGGPCPRCGDTGHNAMQCPYGAVGYHLSTEGRAALERLGLDPRRTPGKVDDPDAFDGIRLTTLPNRKTLYAQMRRRVCEVDGVAVDGHDMIDDTCKHCGGTA